MAVCNVDTWHFGAFFKGKPVFHLEVHREALTDRIEESLNQFRDLYRDRFADVTDAMSKLEGVA